MCNHSWPNSKTHYRKTSGKDSIIFAWGLWQMLKYRFFWGQGVEKKQWLYFTKHNVWKFQKGFNKYTSMILSGYDKLSQIKRLWIIELIHLLALSKARNVYFNAIWIRLCTQWPNQLKFNHKLQKKSHPNVPCVQWLHYYHPIQTWAILTPCWLRVSQLSQAVI